MKIFGKKFLKNLSVLLLSLLIAFVCVIGIYDFIIPDKVSYFEGDELPVFMYAEAALKVDQDISCAEYKLFDILPIKTVELASYKETKLIPGGMPFGVKFFTDGLMIAGFCEVDTEGGNMCPAKDAGLKTGDIITHIDNRAISGTEELSETIDASGGKEITLTYLRDGKAREMKIVPVKSADDGKFKAGVMIRDSGAGIGTVSFIEPESGMFAGLGHGICNIENGELIPMRRGTVVDVTISGIQKGLSGTPGEIKGFFKQNKLGSMVKNTDCGVFGVFSDPPENCLSGALPIGLKNELEEGEATIYCTLDDGVMEEYKVAISAIDKNAEGGKCFSVKVTDPDLLEKTGGIIQGMSGSPIIQNGKLVGAVTHVLINDPTRGYGIFIENMLNQMSDLAS